VGSVVANIKMEAAGFKPAVLQHVGRSLNESAYILARSCNFSSLSFIFDVAPECIRENFGIDVM
jgi:hypothetical protein